MPTPVSAPRPTAFPEAGSAEPAADASALPAGKATCKAALLLAGTGGSRAAVGEVEALGRRLLETGLVARVAFAFAAGGAPSLHTALRDLADKGVDEVLLLPLLVPMEPGLRVWVGRSVQRWRAAAPELRWPIVRLAPPPSDTLGIKEVLREMLGQAEEAAPMGESALFASDASLVPAQHWRVLVCQGLACNSAGAPAVWNQLRLEEDRLALRTRGRGVTACTTGCLGPCSLAPVLQVYPDGQFYGGVDEAGLRRIVHEHLLGGQVVEELAYAPNGRKQRLRARTGRAAAPNVAAAKAEA